MKLDLKGDRNIIEGLTYELRQAELKLNECGLMSDQWLEEQTSEFKAKWNEVESKENELVKDYEKVQADLKEKYAKFEEAMQTEKEQIDNAWDELRKMQLDKEVELNRCKNEKEKEKLKAELDEMKDAEKELRAHENDLSVAERGNGLRKVDEEEQLKKHFQEECERFAEAKNKLKNEAMNKIERDVHEKTLVLGERENSIKMQEKILQDMEAKIKKTTEQLLEEKKVLEEEHGNLVEVWEKEDGELRSATIELNKKQSDAEKTANMEIERIAEERKR